MGATHHGMEEWMLRNVQRLRAEYQQTVQVGARAKKIGLRRVETPRFGKPLTIGWMKMMLVMQGKNRLRGTQESRRKRTCGN